MRLCQVSRKAWRDTSKTIAKFDDFVPADHLLRPLRTLVNGALARLSGLFDEIYAYTGRANIAPEKLMHALWLQVDYSIRSKSDGHREGKRSAQAAKRPKA